MNKNILLIVSIISISAAIILFSNEEESSEFVGITEFIQAPSALGTKENPKKRFEYELKQIIDPSTGKVPDFIHKKERDFVKSIQTREQASLGKTGRILAQNWKLLGPFNVGGRTRAVALDVLDEKTILAGGVSGGMWKTTDAGISWNKTSHPTTLNSSTCLLQDTRAGKENNWYQGTGELRGNSARAPGAPYRGDGIFTSTDNGDTWDLIPSTTNNQLDVFESPFNYVWNIVINNQRNDIDEIYAALYGCIVKSQDGGSTWTTVLGDDLINLPIGTDLNKSNAPFFTNIIQTPLGVFYATLSVFTSTGNVAFGKGIFQSTDGTNWTNISPTGLASANRRIVMSFAPSNEDIIYFFVDEDTPQLWKYDNSGNASSWQNLSSNIPKAEDEDDNFEGINTQESFNMLVKIHPENENIVFLGGTNLYRSTDGFRTSDNSTWIGGYNTESNGSLYEGHHPDQHDMIFYPSNPNKTLSAHDGGLSLSFNNLEENATWVSLNNGYITSQFYSISLSPDKDNNSFIGGMQDNGTYATKTTTPENSIWTRVLGGDGAFTATTPGNIYWYASFQEGQIYRLTSNEELRLTSFARVDPVGGADYLFINPFILDPNNYNRMYLAGGNFIWRNDNLNQIKSGSQETTSTNWTKLNGSRQFDAVITALDISINPKDVLYFGTSTGNILKIDNASKNSSASTTLLSQKDSYPTCISIDPSDADNLMVIYSNYNTPSIFYSNDGGSTFSDVGGNLEENLDGTGNGPSTRWVEIIPMSDGTSKYFLGTSVGLYSTDLLDAENTIWVKEGNNTIGNSVVRMMDYRSSDGKLIIATHGNGVFETNIENTLEVIKESSLKANLSVNKVYPNPFTGSIPVNIDFDIPELGIVKIEIINNLGQQVKILLHAIQFPGRNIATWDGTDDKGNFMRNGIYHYRVTFGGKSKTGKIILER